jgi:L-serine dehydratase
MCDTIAELLKLSEERGCSLWEVILENEKQLTELNEAQIFQKLEVRFEVMLRSSSLALEDDYASGSDGGVLIRGIASRQQKYASGSDTICGGFVNRLMARALSGSEVNASMGRICAAPTAGACGILPAVLISVGEKYKLKRRTVLEGLLTAAGIGAIIAHNATVSGAEGGCQAECGVAAAMSAAAAVQMAGGTNEAAVHAVSIALMNCMGLVCDPVAGLVQVPCAQRNAGQAINAILSADLAMGGMRIAIPADEVVEAMYKTGKSLPAELRETAMGGVAATPQGKAIAKQIFS